MSEKRFTIADGFKIVAIRDNEEIMNSNQVCEKLNKLQKENEQLNENNLHLHHELRLKNDKVLELDKENQNLKKQLILAKPLYSRRELERENKELKLQLEAFKDKLCELGVSDVKLYGKRYYTGLEE